MRRIPLKDHFAESRIFSHRTIISVIVVLALLTTVVVRLVYLQVIDHPYYSTLSHDNRVKVVPVPPTRGLIYDRNGILLAENLPSYRLEITPERVRDMSALLQQLRSLIEIREDDIEQFRKQMRRKRAFDSIPLRFHLTDEEVARLAVIQHRLDGIQIVAGLTRHYPLKEAFAHVVGYVGRIDDNDLRRIDSTNYLNTSHIGKTGIERQYEDLLHGQVGYQQVETNAQGRVLRVLQQNPPVPGRHLHLTLDLPLQAIAEQALDRYNGAIVAIDPGTGAVLAMVSKPGFDPNAFVNGIELEQFKALDNNSSQPLYNRALLGRYPPGSTVKPFIGLAGLRYGIAHEHSQQYCPGFYLLQAGEERRFRDWKKEGHGTVDLNEAIVESCDVYFYDLALNLTIDRIHAFLHAFGFGEKTGIDLPIENAGLLPSRQWKREKKRMPWFPGETLNTGIGQGFLLATPLQLATATAALANRGQPIVPHLLANRADQPQDNKTPPKPELLQSVQKRHWDYILRAMRNVVHSPRGTARSIANPRYEMAGKTGTAQVFGIKQEEEYEAENIDIKLRDHALFIAFAPVQAPKIAVAVIVENGGSGGSVAAPIAGLLIDHYMAVESP